MGECARNRFLIRPGSVSRAGRLSLQLILADTFSCVPSHFSPRISSFSLTSSLFSPIITFLSFPSSFEVQFSIFCLIYFCLFLPFSMKLPIIKHLPQIPDFLSGFRMLSQAPGGLMQIIILQTSNKIFKFRPSSKVRPGVTHATFKLSSLEANQ